MQLDLFDTNPGRHTHFFVTFLGLPGLQSFTALPDLLDPF
jgi:hypothetical protein